MNNKENRDNGKDPKEIEKVLMKSAKNTLINTIYNNPVLDIGTFKEKIKDFLLNPLWNQDSIISLKNTFSILTQKDEKEKNRLMNKIQKIFDENYLKFQDNYLFKGRVKEYEEILIDLIKQIAVRRGQTSIMGTIIGYLIIHENGLTQQQLKELSGSSIGSISTYLNSMEKAKFLEKKMVEGTKTYVYSFGGDLSYMAFNIGFVKKEINDQVTQFIENKLKELENFKNQNGYDILTNQLQDFLKSLKIREKILLKIEKTYKVEQFLKSNKE